MKRQFAFVACLAVLAWTPVQAQEFKFATQNPKGHPLVTGMEKFAEIVAAKSGGKMKVNLFPGGVLGSDQANVSAVQGGTLDMVVLNSGILASQVKAFGIYDFPFMFANPQEADAVVDGPFGKMMHGKLQAQGIVGLAYWELGFRDITNSKRPITKVDDIAGLKLRVIPNAINVDWVKALGANPTPLAFPEVYAALDQKAIDGQENPPTVISANKFYEVQKYLVISNHQYNPQSLIFSKKVWDALGAASQKILSDAAVEAGKYQRQVSRDAAGTALDTLRKNGMEVTELLPAELAKFREATRSVYQQMRQKLGAKVMDLAEASIKRCQSAQ